MLHDGAWQGREMIQTSIGKNGRAFESETKRLAESKVVTLGSLYLIFVHSGG
jgi:hypothetical protein